MTPPAEKPMVETRTWLIHSLLASPPASHRVRSPASDQRVNPSVQLFVTKIKRKRPRELMRMGGAGER